MSAVLFRRLLSNIDDYSTKINGDIQNICKTKLIEAVTQEQDDQMRRKLCDSIAELAKCYLSMKFYNLLQEWFTI